MSARFTRVVFRRPTFSLRRLRACPAAHPPPLLRPPLCPRLLSAVSLDGRTHPRPSFLPGDAPVRGDSEIVEYMGRLRKCFGKGIPVDCFEEADASDGVPFVPNDFAEDDDYPFSVDGEMDDAEFDKALYDLYVDDAEFDKALYDLYVSHKVNRLKRKLSCAAARNVKLKRSSDFPSASTFTRYYGKLFSFCIAGLSPRQVRVIQSYGTDCLLKFVRTEVPLRFVKWLASKFYLDLHFVSHQLYIPLHS